jgi:hypothetical protein
MKRASPMIKSGHRMMQNINSGSTGQHVRLQFDVDGCDRDQMELLQRLKGSTVLGAATFLGRVERE